MTNLQKKVFLPTMKFLKKTGLMMYRKPMVQNSRNKVDLLVGGAPCQSFSMVGKRKGLKDNRGNLTLHFIRKINEIKPKVFIFENVKALLNVDNGMAWKTVYGRFQKTGYNIYYELLNARNYGMPQNRERLFVIGFKNDQSFSFPKPIELENTMQDYLEGKFDKKFLPASKGNSFCYQTEES